MKTFKQFLNEARLGAPKVTSLNLSLFDSEKDEIQKLYDLGKVNESSPFESSLSYNEKKKLKADLLDVINKLIKKYNGYDQSVNNYIDLTHDTFQTHRLVWSSYITFSARDYEGFKKELTKELKKMNLKPKKFFADRRTVDMDASYIGYYTPAHKEKVCYFYAVSFDVPEKSKLDEGIDNENGKVVQKYF